MEPPSERDGGIYFSLNYLRPLYSSTTSPAPSAFRTIVVVVVILRASPAQVAAPGRACDDPKWDRHPKGTEVFIFT